jgi:hypothetical protein
MTLQVNSARQTKPSKLSWFGERAAGSSDDEPTNKEGHGCYAIITFVIAEGKQREGFKIPMIRVPANKAQQTQLVQRESCRTK